MVDQDISPGTLAGEYWGGLIDEGLVAYIKEVNVRTKAEETLLYKPVLEFKDSRRKALIDSFKDQFGYQKSPSGADTYPHAWISQDNARSLAFLTRVNPLLKVQDPEANLMKDYLERRLERATKQPSPEDRLEEDLRFYHDLIKLKYSPHDRPFTATVPRLAGILDKGGSIAIRTDNSPPTNTQYKLTLSYESPRLSIAKALEDRYSIAAKPKAHVDGQTSYCFQAENGDARDILVDLMPFFRYQRSFAELGISFHAVQAQMGKEYRFDRVDSEETARSLGFSSGLEYRHYIRNGFVEKFKELRAKN